MPTSLWGRIWESSRHHRASSPPSAQRARRSWPGRETMARSVCGLENGQPPNQRARPPWVGGRRSARARESRTGHEGRDRQREARRDEGDM